MERHVSTTSETIKNPYKMCRENAGLSQEYAAGLLHIAPRTLSDYENDKTTVPDDIVMAMGKIYDTNFLVWWHLKYRTPYGEILPEIYEPTTVGDMMFSYVLAKDATDDSYESFKDVYEDRQLRPDEIPKLEEAIHKAEGAASNLTAIALFARKKIQECKEVRQDGNICDH